MFSRLFQNFTQNEPRDVIGSDKTILQQVTADASRCVQCGICSHNCPVGISVREYARRGENVTDANCITCGECIEKCPRGTLRWGPAILLRADNTIEINPNGLPGKLQLEKRVI